MGVCRFFLEGRCHYGQNCRNEHPRRGNDGGGGQYNRQYNTYSNDRQYNNQNQQSQYSFDRRTSQRNLVKPTTFQNQNRFAVFNTSNNTETDAYEQWHQSNNRNNQSSQHRKDEDEEIIKQIKLDIEQWGKSNMWPYSCYSYDRGKNCLQDLADISPEEMRVLYHLHGENTYVKLNTDIEAQYNHIKLGLFNMPVDKQSPDAQNVLNQIKSIAGTNPSEKLKIAELYGKGHDFKNTKGEIATLPTGEGLASPVSFNNLALNNTNVFAQATLNVETVEKAPIKTATAAISIFGSSSPANDIDLSTYRKQEAIFAFELGQFKANKFDNLDNIPEFPPSKELCV